MTEETEVLDVTPPKTIEELFEEYDLQPNKFDIITHPSSILKEVANEVEDFGDETKQLIVDMFYTLKTQEGIGLAAPQIGVSKRVVVLMFDAPLLMINPTIVAREGKQTQEEGCLSIPGYFEKVKRAEHIRVVYQNDEGVQMDLEARGIAAQCIQHEIDHLDGKLFVDRLSPMRKLQSKKKIEKAYANLIT